MENHPVEATFFMDFEDNSVQEFITKNTSANKPKEEKAIELYYAVRDLIRYDPYTYSLNKSDFKASYILKAGRAWCVPKAILYAACCRAIEVPANLGFADVRNHLSTERMRKTMKTDVFHWHGYASVFLYGKWVKATPAFNIELCEKFRLKPLEFTGREDSIYHPFDMTGNRHMEYLKDYGIFEYFPFERMVRELKQLYGNTPDTDGDFDQDVEQEIKTMRESEDC